MPAPEPENTEILRQVRAWLQQARQVTVLTGAGVSAESGVPTFRDVQTGIWAQFDPQEMASEPGFRAHPQRVWQWYAHRRALVSAVQPNAAHRALAQFACHHPGKLQLVTQNVDGLHQRAGSPEVIALHGDLLAINGWTRCARSAIWRLPCSVGASHHPVPPAVTRCAPAWSGLASTCQRRPWRRRKPRCKPAT